MFADQGFYKWRLLVHVRNEYESWLADIVVCSYLTTTEWSSFYGGKKATVEVGEKSKFRRMPFFCCR